MALTRATGGNVQQIQAAQLNQIIDLINGLAGAGQPVSLTALSDALNYALTVKNAGTGSKGLIVYAADGSTILLQATGSGVKASPDGTTSADVAGALVTESAVQTLSSKTLTTPTISNFTNANHDHGDADDGGSLAASITLTTPTIADFTNAQHDHGDADDGGAILATSHTHSSGRVTNYRNVSQAAPPSVNSQTGEQTSWSTTITGGTLGSDGILALKHLARYQNNTGANRDLTVKVKYGGVVVAIFTLTAIVPNAGFRSIILDGEIVASGTAAQTATFRLRLSDATAAASAAPPTNETSTASSVMVQHSGATVDSTSDQTLTLTIEHSVADTTYTHLMSLVEKV